MNAEVRRNAAASVGALLLPRTRRRTSACIPTRSRPARSRRSTCAFPASRKAPTSRRSTCCSRRASPASTTKTSPAGARKVIETKLATPISEDGETIDTEVSQIVWTWTGPLGKVEQRPVHPLPAVAGDPRQRDRQSARIQDRPDLQQRPGRALDRPVADRRTPLAEDQRHGQGRRDRGHRGRRGWAGSRAERGYALHAAPVATSSSGGGASKGLGVAALVIGALGLLAGIAALIATRRRPARRATRARRRTLPRDQSARCSSSASPSTRSSSSCSAAASRMIRAGEWSSPWEVCSISSCSASSKPSACAAAGLLDGAALFAAALLERVFVHRPKPTASGERALRRGAALRAR